MEPVPVWFDDLQVGAVHVAQDGTLSFTYSENWLATRGAFALSVTLPLKKTTYPTELVSPWLANLLPEEEQLSILTRSLGLDRSDTLAVLHEIGGDTAGALSFGAPSDRSKWTYTPLCEFYDVDEPQLALERHFADLSKRPFLVGEDGVRLSLAGGQKKSALALIDQGGAPVLRLPQDGDRLAIPRHGAPSTLIIKPDNPHLPGIVENETYCLTLANAVGLSAAQAAVFPAGQRKAICVLRYDRRIGRRGALQRVHQEDFAQANSVPPGRKYERGTMSGPTLQTLLQTGRHVSAQDALALLDQFIFNVLTANTDAHAKNHSLILPVAGPVRLAPLYDVSTVLPWPHVVQYFAQNLAGKKRKPGDMDERHWDWIAEELGYRGADVRARVETLIDLFVKHRTAVTETVCAFPGAISGYVDEAASLIEDNALRIAGRLSKARTRKA